MDIKEQILVALGLNKDEEVKLAWQAKGEDGTIYVSTAEELEAGVDISVLTEDGTTILLPVGTYKTDTGVSFRVEEEGIVAEVMESETEEEVTEEEEVEASELAEEDKDDYDEEADVADWRGMEKRIENLEIAVAKLKEEKVGGDDEVEEVWHPNQYVMMISNANQKKSAIARFGGHHVPLKKVINDKIPDWKIFSRNKEQAFAIDLLLDPTVKVVTLIGRAGSGKTLCAIAAGLQQTIGLRENHYSRLIVSRPVQPLGKDIGYLPGTMQEKMLPWLMPIQDNLQFLMGNDKSALQIYLDKGKIEIEALTYIRGRSISDAYIIIDEAQNLTMHEVKTIITRIGEGTKIVLTGDIEQIDNIYVNETSNGLAHAVEKFKEFYLSGHVTFTKGERSETATLASKIL